jgi:hypothetical protein
VINPEKLSRRDFLFKKVGPAAAGIAFGGPPRLSAREIPVPLEKANPYPSLTEEDLKAAGIDKHTRPKLLKLAPVLQEIQTEMVEENDGYAIAWEAHASFVHLENSSKMFTDSPHGPYQIISKDYPPTRDIAGFRQATYDATDFLVELGQRINISPLTLGGKFTNLDWPEWAKIAAHYNGLTEPIICFSKKAYGHPETGVVDWRYSAYGLGGWDLAAELVNQGPLVDKQGRIIDTHRMPIRLSDAYPANDPETACREYFVQMERDGFCAHAARLIFAQNLARKREAEAQANQRWPLQRKGPR